MAKNVALLSNNTVVNILWCSDNFAESETYISVGDKPVAIGDTYEDGKFYRDGIEVLSPLEEALQKNAIYEEALTAMGIIL